MAKEKKFLVPFEENLRGVYLVEAKSLKQAKRIVADGNFAKEIWEARGDVFYSENDIVELPATPATTEFIVKVEEKFIHTLTIEASNADEASEKAYALLRKGLTEDEKTASAYEVEPFEFTGEWTAEVV